MKATSLISFRWLAPGYQCLWLGPSWLCFLFVLFFFFLFEFWRQIGIEPFALFHRSGLITCILLRCFTDEVAVPHAGQTYICFLKIHQNPGQSFAPLKLICFPGPTPSSFPIDRSKAVPMLQLFFVRLRFQMWHFYFILLLSFYFVLIIYSSASFVWFLGKNVLHDCGIFWVSSLIFCIYGYIHEA